MRILPLIHPIYRKLAKTGIDIYCRLLDITGIVSPRVFLVVLSNLVISLLDI